jgi:hypothetical protein
MAVTLLEEVEQAAVRATNGRLALESPISVRAVSRRRLQKMQGERLLGLYQDGVIWVNHDLDRRGARAVIAHEFGHAWLFENRSDIATPNEALFEGFAEFVSYLVLLEVGDTEGVRQIEYADQSVYGTNARKLIALSRKEGLGSVLRLALTGGGV